MVIYHQLECGATLLREECIERDGVFRERETQGGIIIHLVFSATHKRARAYYNKEEFTHAYSKLKVRQIV